MALSRSLTGTSITLIAALILSACMAEKPLISTKDAGASPELAIEQIFANHVAAIGGAGAIRAIENVRIVAQITEPTFTVNGTYRASREGEVRVDIFADSRRVFSEGIDAQGGWQQHGAGAAIAGLSDAGHAALVRGVEFNIFGLNDLEYRGHTASLYGRETVGSVTYYVIEVTMEDGFRRYFYINSDNWLIERTREVSALHPDLDPEARQAETLHYGYDEHCGVLMATETRKIDLLNGDQLQHTIADSIECNSAPTALDIARPSPSAEVFSGS